MKIGLPVFVAVVIVATAASTVSGAPGSLRRASDGRCTVTGAQWKIGAKKGTKYIVGTRGADVTCAFVGAWVPKLTHSHLSQIGGTGLLQGGPPGWTCRAVGQRYVGSCFSTETPGEGFTWTAKR
jgi:hypothetical protein